MQINGLYLPVALIRAIGERRWRRPANECLRRVFRESPLRVQLYDLDAMHAANRRWLNEKDPAYFGHSDDKKPPGNIDPARSLLLGLLGPHMPFALDYRISGDRPRVLSTDCPRASNRALPLAACASAAARSPPSPPVGRVAIATASCYDSEVIRFWRTRTLGHS